MSREQDYSAPSGTKYPWNPKSLNYSPWVCQLSDHLAAKKKLSAVRIIPMNITLTVNLSEGVFHWEMRVRDWCGEVTDRTGNQISALKACLEAEKVGEKAFRKLTPEWVLLALAHGWGPPVRHTVSGIRIPF
jgi:hypothetical protein